MSNSDTPNVSGDSALAAVNQFATQTFGVPSLTTQASDEIAASPLVPILESLVPSSASSSSIPNTSATTTHDPDSMNTPAAEATAAAVILGRSYSAQVLSPPVPSVTSPHVHSSASSPKATRPTSAKLKRDASASEVAPREEADAGGKNNSRPQSARNNRQVGISPSSSPRSQRLRPASARPLRRAETEQTVRSESSTPRAEPDAESTQPHAHVPGASIESAAAVAPTNAPRPQSPPMNSTARSFHVPLFRQPNSSSKGALAPPGTLATDSFDAIAQSLAAPAGIRAEDLQFAYETSSPPQVAPASARASSPMGARKPPSRPPSATARVHHPQHERTPSFTQPSSSPPIQISGVAQSGVAPLHVSRPSTASRSRPQSALPNQNESPSAPVPEQDSVSHNPPMHPADGKAHHDRTSSYSSDASVLSTRPMSARASARGHKITSAAKRAWSIQSKIIRPPSANSGLTNRLVHTLYGGNDEPIANERSIRPKPRDTSFSDVIRRAERDASSRGTEADAEAIHHSSLPYSQHMYASVHRPPRARPSSAVAPSTRFAPSTPLSPRQVNKTRPRTARAYPPSFLGAPPANVLPRSPLLDPTEKLFLGTPEDRIKNIYARQRTQTEERFEKDLIRQSNAPPHVPDVGIDLPQRNEANEVPNSPRSVSPMKKATGSEDSPVRLRSPPLIHPSDSSPTAASPARPGYTFVKDILTGEEKEVTLQHAADLGLIRSVDNDSEGEDAPSYPPDSNPVSAIVRGGGTGFAFRSDEAPISVSEEDTFGVHSSFHHPRMKLEQDRVRELGRQLKLDERQPNQRNPGNNPAWKAYHDYSIRNLSQGEVPQSMATENVNPNYRTPSNSIQRPASAVVDPATGSLIDETARVQPINPSAPHPRDPHTFYPSNFIPAHLLSAAELVKKANAADTISAANVSVGIDVKASVVQGLEGGFFTTVPTPSIGDQGPLRPLTALQADPVTGEIVKTKSREHAEELHEMRKQQLEFKKLQKKIMTEAPLTATRISELPFDEKQPNSPSTVDSTVEHRRRLTGTFYHTAAFRAQIRNIRDAKGGAVTRPQSARPASAKSFGDGASASTHSDEFVPRSPLNGRTVGAQSTTRTNLLSSKHGIQIRHSLDTQRKAQQQHVKQLQGSKDWGAESEVDENLNGFRIQVAQASILPITDKPIKVFLDSSSARTSIPPKIYFSRNDVKRSYKSAHARRQERLQQEEKEPNLPSEAQHASAAEMLQTEQQQKELMDNSIPLSTPPSSGEPLDEQLQPSASNLTESSTILNQPRQVHFSDPSHNSESLSRDAILAGSNQPAVASTPESLAAAAVIAGNYAKREPVHPRSTNSSRLRAMATPRVANLLGASHQIQPRAFAYSPYSNLVSQVRLANSPYTVASHLQRSVVSLGSSEDKPAGGGGGMQFTSSKWASEALAAANLTDAIAASEHKATAGQSGASSSPLSPDPSNAWITQVALQHAGGPHRPVLVQPPGPHEYATIDEITTASSPRVIHPTFPGKSVASTAATRSARTSRSKTVHSQRAVPVHSPDDVVVGSPVVRPLQVVNFNQMSSTSRSVLSHLPHHPDEARLFREMWTPSSLLTNRT